MGSGPNWYQIANKTCYSPKVSKLYVEKVYYVNRPESVIFVVHDYIFYRSDYNVKGEPHEIEF